MNPKFSLRLEEARVLRRETRGDGNLVRLGLIEITDKGREWFDRDRKQIIKARADAGSVGGTAKGENAKAKP